MHLNTQSLSLRLSCAVYFCAVELNACMSNPCRRRGTCITWPNNTYYCNCKGNFTGVNCEHGKTPTYLNIYMDENSFKIYTVVCNLLNSKCTSRRLCKKVTEALHRSSTGRVRVIELDNKEVFWRRKKTIDPPYCQYPD